MESIDKTLSPLKKMTDLLSGEDYVTISAIKPMLQHIFESVLKSEKDDTTLTKDMRKIIKDDLEARYSIASWEIKLIMNLANFIDPRFKADYLSDDELALVKEEITIDIDVIDTMDLSSQGDTGDKQQHQKDNDVMDCEDQEGPKDKCRSTESESFTEVTEPPKKKSKTDRNIEKGQIKLGQIFKKLREQKASSPSTSGTGTMTIPEKLESEIDHYINSPLADSESDPLKWWKINYVHYLFLAKITKKYLSICATNCPSERLFSSSDKIVSTIINNLKPEKVNMLAFLSKNMK